MDDSRLNILIMAWGSYLDTLKLYALPSVMWPDNLPACGYTDILVDCYTHSSDKDRMESIVRPAFAGITENVKVWVHDGNDMDVSLFSFIDAISNAFTRDARMFYLGSDSVYGNGSVSSLARYARGKNVCVAGVHTRVDRNRFIERFPNGLHSSPISNPDLVDLGMKLAHQSAAASWFGSDNGTADGGISMTRITDKLTAMVHHLPTIYLAKFTKGDVDYFNRCGHMGAYDHEWPATLISDSIGGRFRMIGSSDLFFAVELTDPQRNRVCVAPNSGGVEDYHREQHKHNALCGHFVTLLRGNG